MTLFKKENIALQKLSAEIEAIEYVFKINSPLDATVIIGNEELLTIQTYNEALPKKISLYKR